MILLLLLLLLLLPLMLLVPGDELLLGVSSLVTGRWGAFEFNPPRLFAGNATHAGSSTGSQ